MRGRCFARQGHGPGMRNGHAHTLCSFVSVFFLYSFKDDTGRLWFRTLLRATILFIGCPDMAVYGLMNDGLHGLGLI
jgi:hypothetical protein